jgi:acyl carrier protein
VSLKQELIEFIQANLFDEAPKTPVAEGEHLIDRGIIDSMGLMKIMLFIEERTGIRIPDDEVLPENFQSVSSIEQTVERLQSKGQRR